MKLDLDPGSNKEQLNKLVVFHKRYSVMYSPGFWYFFGGLLLVGGLVTLFIPELFSRKGPSELGNTESSLLFIAIGASILVACKFVVSMASKLRSYEPRESKGNEWEQ